MKDPRHAAVFAAVSLCLSIPCAAAPIVATIDELTVKITGGAKYEEIQRRLLRFRGTTYIVEGNVESILPDDRYATFVSDSGNTIHCVFGKLPPGLAVGQSAVRVRGILAGYSFGLEFEHCTLEPTTQAATAPVAAPPPPKPRKIAARPKAEPPAPAAPMPWEPKGRMVCTPRRGGGETCSYVEPDKK